MHEMRVALFLLAASLASVSPPSPGASTFAKATADKSARQAAPSAQAPPTSAAYDLLLKGGHVIDSRNNLSAVRDVAIKDGKVAAVAADIPAAQAFKTCLLYTSPSPRDS